MGLVTHEDTPPAPYFHTFWLYLYAMEDVLLEASQIRLYPIRQKHSKRPLPPYIAYVQHYYRKRIETVGSVIERMRPKSIHAVTAEGFEWKVFLFVLAYSLNCP